MGYSTINIKVACYEGCGLLCVLTEAYMKFSDSNINIERIGPAFEVCMRRVQSNSFFWLFI